MHVYMCFDHFRWWNILRMQSVQQTDLNSCPTPLMVSSLEQASQKRRKKWPLESCGCNMYSSFWILEKFYIYASWFRRRKKREFSRENWVFTKVSCVRLVLLLRPCFFKQISGRHKHTHYCEVLTQYIVTTFERAPAVRVFDHQ